MSKDRTQKYLRTGFTIYTTRHLRAVQDKDHTSCPQPYYRECAPDCTQQSPNETNRHYSAKPN